MVFSASLFSQKKEKIEKVCGEYTYFVPDNVSLEQAKQTALKRAQIEALAEKFGTNISQQNLTNIRIENGKSDIDSDFRLESEVKGEWVRNTKEPEYKISYDEKKSMQIVKVSVCGEARENAGLNIDLSIKVLNNADLKYETESFRSGEDIFLSFRSPVNGYLTVYLEDSETVQCLLPYPDAPSANVSIKAGKDYIFFSEKYAEQNEKSIVSEYTLSCEKSTEYNRLYVIFSPNEFIKANDAKSKEELLPRELPLKDFQNWIANNRQKDKDIKVEIKTLTIKK